MRNTINLNRWFDSFHLVDGAISTELFRTGCPVSVAPEQWALNHLKALSQLHRAYLGAGAEALTAATFGANLFNPLAEFNEDTLAEALQTLVSTAREAAGDEILVAASVGPLALFSSSDPASTELRAHYRKHLEILAQTDCDIIAFETFTSLSEAELALEQAAAMGLPCSITFAPDDSGTLEDGDTLASWVERISRTEVLALGCNCSPDIESAIAVAARIRELTDLPLIMRPNAGQPDADMHFPVTAQVYAKHAVAMFDEGVDVLGGCCGTTPEHIAVAADAIRSFIEAEPPLTDPDAIS